MTERNYRAELDSLDDDSQAGSEGALPPGFAAESQAALPEASGFAQSPLFEGLKQWQAGLRQEEFAKAIGGSLKNAAEAGFSADQAASALEVKPPAPTNEPLAARGEDLKEPREPELVPSKLAPMTEPQTVTVPNPFMVPAETKSPSGSPPMPAPWEGFSEPSPEKLEAAAQARAKLGMLTPEESQAEARRMAEEAPRRVAAARERLTDAKQALEKFDAAAAAGKAPYSSQWTPQQLRDYLQQIAKAAQQAFNEAEANQRLVEAMAAGKAPLPVEAKWRSYAESGVQGVVGAGTNVIKFAGIIGGYLGSAAGADVTSNQNAAYHLGTEIDDWVRRQFPSDPARQYETGTRIAQQLGFMAALIGSDGLAGLVARAPEAVAVAAKGTRLAPASIAVAGGGVPQYEAATQAMEENPQSVTEGDRLKAFLAGSVLGGTMMIPLGAARAAVPARTVEQFASGAGRSGVIGAAQMAGYSFANDAIAQQFYDPDRQIGAQAGEDALLGFLFGAGAHTVRQAIMNRYSTPEEIGAFLKGVRERVSAEQAEYGAPLREWMAERAREGRRIPRLPAPGKEHPSEPPAGAAPEAPAPEGPSPAPVPAEKRAAPEPPAAEQPSSRLPEPFRARFEPVSDIGIANIARQRGIVLPDGATRKEYLEALYQHLEEAGEFNSTPPGETGTVEAAAPEAGRPEATAGGAAEPPAIQGGPAQPEAAGAHEAPAPVPTFNDLRSILPLDADGYPDIASLNRRIQEQSGKPGWYALTDGERRQIYDEYAAQAGNRIPIDIEAEAVAPGDAGEVVPLERSAGRPQEAPQASQSARYAASTKMLAAPGSPAPATADAGKAHTIATPDGSMFVQAVPEVIELASLKHARGELQPRDRSRAESGTGIKERAANLDPARLQISPVSDTGAPVITADGTILSGNGRAMSIREAYQNPDLTARAEAYRASLGGQATGMKEPVLVMRLPADMRAEDQKRFADLSNRSSIAQMSATERAIRDANALGLSGFVLYQGGDLNSGVNRPFLRQFLHDVVTPQEIGAVSKDGALAKEGVDRINAAILAAAYKDPSVLSAMLESTDDNIRSVTNALRDAAGRFAELRAGIEAGVIKPEMDCTPALLEAVKLISHLRTKGIRPAQYFAQQDMFAERDPLVEEWVRAFYNDDLSRPVSQQKMTEVLHAYAGEAIKHQTGGFIPDETQARDVLAAAVGRIREPQPSLFTGRPAGGAAAENEIISGGEAGDVGRTPQRGPETRRPQPAAGGREPVAEPGREPAEPAEPSGQHRSDAQLWHDFRNLLAGTGPVSRAARELGIGRAALEPLIGRGIKEGLLRRDARGAVRRTPKAKEPVAESTATANIEPKLAEPQNEGAAESAAERGAARPEVSENGEGLRGSEAPVPEGELPGNVPGVPKSRKTRVVSPEARAAGGGDVSGGRGGNDLEPAGGNERAAVRGEGGEAQGLPASRERVRGPGTDLQPAQPGLTAQKEQPAAPKKPARAKPPLSAKDKQEIREARQLAEQERIDRATRNYRIVPDDRIGEGGPKEKVRANIEAIRVLKQIGEEGGREATEAEKKALVKYVGWGAFAQEVFDTRAWSRHADTWKKERAELQNLLTADEFRAARESTLNAHYTSADVIRGIWRVLDHMGYRGGRALEPSAGIGHFIGLIPKKMAAETAWTAVELDKLTGGILKALYGGSDVRAGQGFEEQNWPDAFFDLAISNVPFGSYKLRDINYRTPMLVHDYFFVKSLDKVRPGGIVAFITSSGTLDKESQTARKEMAKRASFLGAIRLPGGGKGAFAGNAGTEVTTDVIFLRKRMEGEPDIEASWPLELREIQTPDGPIRINQWFAAAPEMMLGEMRLASTMYRAGEPALIGDATDLENRIAAAGAKLLKDAFIPRGELKPFEKTGTGETSGAKAVKEGGYYRKGKKLYRKIQGVGEEQALSLKDQQKIASLLSIRDAVNELMDKQVRGDLKGRAELREALNGAYDAFVEKYGPISQENRSVSSRLDKSGNPIITRRKPNFSLFSDDPDAYKLLALEDYDPETNTASKTAIFTSDILKPYVRPEIAGPADALAVSLNEHGRIDIPSIARSLKLSEDEAIHALGGSIYLNPKGDIWETRDDYLSGDVVEKLAAARAAAATDPRYNRNVRALETVQPAPIPPEEITAPFGAPWVPIGDYEAFLTDHLGGTGVRLSLNPATKTWSFAAEPRFPQSAYALYATPRMTVADIVLAALNSTPIRIYDKIEGGKTVFNETASKEAAVKAKALREAFTGNFDTGAQGWIWQDPDRTERLAALYNQAMNRLVPVNTDGSHLTFPGMAQVIRNSAGEMVPFELRAHQKNAIWRIIRYGNTLLAHTVGSGKTFTMIAAGMEMKRLGMIQRPMYVVPNHMLEQFSREFLQAYPNAKILVADKDSMAAAKRKEFAARVASDRWDGIIITHSAFGRIGLRPEVYKEHIQAELAELEQWIEDYKATEGKRSPTVKQLEAMKKSAEGRLEALIKAEGKDIGTTFEELGADHLFVDESHLFKRLAFNTRLGAIKGVDPAGSQRAMDLYLKIRQLEKSKPGRAAVFATGTPISNTMAELFTIQRYLQLGDLKLYGIENFDAWAKTFGEITTKLERGADGRSLKEVTGFSSFVNIPELIAIYSRIADTQTAESLKLPRPKLKNGAVKIIEAELSAYEERYMQDLILRAENMRSVKDKSVDNMLKVFTEGKKLATDGRLLDSGQPFNENGKIARAVKEIYRVWKEGENPALAQIVFLDMGVPGGKGKAGKAILGGEPAGDETEAALRKIREGAGAAIEDEGEPGGEIAPDAGMFADTGFNLYGDLRDRLVAAGIPRNQIAFIHDAGNDIKKAELFQAVREGKVRILVGTTPKMGVGTNVQTKLIAKHDLTVPLRPADLEQGDGRILRQGNENKEVEVYRYVTLKSLDALLWQILERKSKFIAQIWAGARGLRRAEDIDDPLPEAAQMKAVASGDPSVLEAEELKRELQNLEVARRIHARSAIEAARLLKTNAANRERLAGAIAKVEKDAAKVTDTSGANFKVTLKQGGVIEERKAAGMRLLAGIRPVANRFWGGEPEENAVGSISGLTMLLDYRRGEDGPQIRPMLEGELLYGPPNGWMLLTDETDPVGLVKRYENILRDVPGVLERYKAELAKEEQDKPRLEKQAKGSPFPRQAEMERMLRRLQDLEGRAPAPQTAAEQQPVREQEPTKGAETRVNDSLSTFQEAHGYLPSDAVASYAARIEQSRGGPAFDAVMDEIRADPDLQKQDFIDLARLSGRAVGENAAKEQALATITARHRGVGETQFAMTGPRHPVAEAIRRRDREAAALDRWRAGQDEMTPQEADAYHRREVARIDSEFQEEVLRYQLAEADNQFALTAYHGSPHDFGRFDAAKIGTGEGAQTFGHGLYFAEAQAVAETYRNVHKKIAAWTSTGDEYLKLPDGRLYTVSLDVESDDLLDWDKPLIEQSGKVRAALSKLGVLPKTDLQALEKQGESGRAQAQYLRDRMEQTGAEAYDELELKLGSAKAASKALLDASVSGTRYLDRDSRAAGEGTRNYVIFDHGKVKITAKDGKPVTTGEREDVLAQSQHSFALTASQPGLTKAQRRQQLADETPSLLEAVAKAKTVAELLPALDRVKNSPLLSQEGQGYLQKLTSYLIRPSVLTEAYYGLTGGRLGQRVTFDALARRYREGAAALPSERKAAKAGAAFYEKDMRSIVRHLHLYGRRRGEEFEEVPIYAAPWLVDEAKREVSLTPFLPWTKEGLQGAAARLQFKAWQQGQPVFAFIGEKGAANLELAGKPVAREALDFAEKLESEGASRDEIWFFTTHFLKQRDPDLIGVFRGIDGLWRIETKDRISVVLPKTPKEAAEKSGVEPNAMASYPHLEEIYGKDFVTEQRVGVHPAYEQAGAAKGSRFMTFSPNVSKARKAVAHETQHIVQMQEGFAVGSSAVDFSPEQIEAQRARLLETGEPLEKLSDDYVSKVLYYLTAGEVEARNVEKRLTMPVARRREIPPWETQSISDELQTVRSAPSGTPRSGQIASLTPAFQEKAGDAAAAIAAAIKGWLPPDTEVRVSDRLFRDLNTNQVSTEPPAGPYQQIRGYANPGLGIIHVAMSSGPEQALANGRHETVGLLKGLGFFNGEEWRLLVERAHKVGALENRFVPLPSGNVSAVEAYRGLLEQQAAALGLEGDEAAAWVEEGLDRERVEHLAEEWATGRTSYGSRIDAIFERIVRFLQAIRNALRGLGFRTYHDVFESVFSGEQVRKNLRGRGGARETYGTGGQNASTGPRSNEGLRGGTEDAGGPATGGEFGQGGAVAPRGSGGILSETAQGPRPLRVPGYRGYAIEHGKRRGVRSSSYYLYPGGSPELAPGQDIKKLGKPLAELHAEETAPGELRVKWVRGRGHGQRLYDAVERDTGGEIVPSQVLTRDARRLWLKRDPGAVAHYRELASEPGAFLGPEELLARKAYYEHQLPKLGGAEETARAAGFHREVSEAYGSLPEQVRVQAETPAAGIAGTAGTANQFALFSRTPPEPPDIKPLAEIIEDLKKALGITATQGLYRFSIRGAGSKKTRHFAPPEGTRSLYDKRAGVARYRAYTDFQAIVDSGAKHIESIYGDSFADLEAGHAAELEDLAAAAAIDTAFSKAATGRDIEPATPLETISQGFNEFFRGYLTDPERVRVLAPEFYGAFEDFLDGHDPAMLQRLEKAQLVQVSQDYSDYLRAASVDQAIADMKAASRPFTPKTTKEVLSSIGEAGTVQGWMDTLYQTVLDRGHPIYVMVRELLRRADAAGIKGADGKPLSLTVEQNPYKLFRLLPGAYRQAQGWIKNGMPNYRRADAGFQVFSKTGGRLLQTLPTLAEAQTYATGAGEPTEIRTMRGHRSASLYGAIKEASGRSHWETDETARDQLDQYLLSRRFIEEWKVYEAKMGKVAALNDQIAEAKEQVSLVREGLRKDRAKLQRRQDALIRAETARRIAERRYGKALRAEEDEVQYAAYAGGDITEEAAVKARMDRRRDALIRADALYERERTAYERAMKSEEDEAGFLQGAGLDQIARARSQQRLRTFQAQIREADSRMQVLDERKQDIQAELNELQFIFEAAGHFTVRQRTDSAQRIRTLRKEVRAAGLELETHTGKAAALRMQIGALEAAVEAHETEIKARQTDAAAAKQELKTARKAGHGALRKPDRRSRAEHEGIVQDLLNRNPRLPAAAEMVYDFLWQSRIHDFQAGRLSKEQFDYSETRKHFYVPIQRDISDRGGALKAAAGIFGKPVQARFKPDKAFLGSERDSISPLRTIVEQAYHRASATLHNDMVRALVDFAEQVPGGGAIVERAGKRKTAEGADAFDVLKQAFLDAGYDPLDAHSMAQRIEADFNDRHYLIEYHPDRPGPAGALTLHFYENGERFQARLNEKEWAAATYRAMTAMGREMSDLYIDMLRKPAMAITGLVWGSPGFFVRHAARTIHAAFHQSGGWHAPRTWPFVNQGFGLYHLLKDTDLNRAYLETGGISAGVNVARLAKSNERAEIQALRKQGITLNPKTLAPAMAAGAAIGAGISAGLTVGVGTGFGALAGAKAGTIAAAGVAAMVSPSALLTGALAGASLHRGPSHFLETMAHVADFVERTTRVGTFAHAYNAALRNNPEMTPYQAELAAAITARDICDLERYGSRMTLIGWLVPFMRAHIAHVESAWRRAAARSDRGYAISPVKMGVASAAAAGATLASTGVAYPAVAALLGTPALLTALAARSETVHKMLLPFGRHAFDMPLSAEERAAVPASAMLWFSMLVSVFFAGLIAAIYREDQEYQDVKHAVKDRWITVKLGGQWLKWPRAFQFGLPGAMAEAAIERDFHGDPDFAERVTAQLWEQLPPSFLDPQFFKLYGDIKANYDSLTRRAIVPEWMKTLPPEEQFGAYSSMIAIAVSRGVNENPWLKGIVEKTGEGVFRRRVELSPYLVDYMLRNGLGPWGEDIQNASNQLRPGGATSQKLTDMPLIGGAIDQFLFDPFRKSGSLEAFWRKAGRATEGLARAAKTYKHDLEVNGEAVANSRLAELPEGDRAYALAENSSASWHRRNNPWVRALAVNRIIARMQRQVIMGDLQDTTVSLRTERIALSPSKSDEVRDLLQQIAVAEAHNTLVFEKEGKFASSKEINAGLLLDTLKASSEQVYDEYLRRLRAAHVRDWEGVKASWPDIKKMLIENWEASLGSERPPVGARHHKYRRAEPAPYAPAQPQ